MADRLSELSALAYAMLKIKGAAWGSPPSQESVTRKRVRETVRYLVETMPANADAITTGGLVVERDEDGLGLYVYVGDL